MINTKKEKEAFLLANRFGVKMVMDLSEYPFVRNKVKKFPYAFVKKKLALPLGEENGQLLVAIARPLDLEVIEEIRCLIGQDIQEVFCPQSKLEEAIEKCYHQNKDEASQYIADLRKESKTSEIDFEQEYDLLNQKSNSPVIRMLNMIIMEAIQQGSSDIHFEPLENDMVVRYRIDGVLQFRHSPPQEFQQEILTRIKVLAKLDIAEHRLPQDGRIKLKMAGRQIDFRVSAVPIIYGERIVLRILDMSNVVLGLEKIGMESHLLKQFKQFISQNQGVVFVTGPTGSGKTTTLYSSISEISSSEINIMTIEDPIEYKLPGIAQISANPKIGLTFARGLRHILRQDPDVVLIGEIRDRETAEIAIQASLTGHLVLSTLHTNDAPSALTRLVDMGIEPYLLSSTVLAVLAQRLIRCICEHCKVSYFPSNEELRGLGLTIKDLQDEVLYKGKGCTVCYGSGYKGRCGIYELMPMSPLIKNQILQTADSTTLQRIAVKSGMKGLRKEGSRLVIEGVSTSSEVLRVTRQLEVEE